MRTKRKYIKWFVFFAIYIGLLTGGVLVTKVNAANLSSSVIENAISWGQSQKGSTAYNDKCQAFVWQCFNNGGFPNNSSISFASAKLCGDALITNTDKNAPRGACVFFDCSSHGYGHIGISLGNGQMIHAGHNGVEVTTFTDDAYLKNYYWLTYRGWGVWGAQKGNTIGNSTTSTISVGTGDATDITETNAVVRGVVNKTSNITSGIRVGVRIGTSSNNFNIKSSYLEDVVSGAYSQNNGTNFPMWFNINNELGVTLKKGTTYYYQMMATYGGKTYYGEVKSFRTAGDGTAPVISNVKVSNVTNKGYTVSCTVTDNVGVAKVQFPTWTLKNDQDDLIKDWGSNAKASGTKNGSTYTYQVKISDHNNETGMYTTHIYAYDSAGNYSSKEVGNINVDGTSPTVNKIESFDVKNDRFSVKCTASDNVGVTKINYYCWGEGDAWDKGGICKQTTATNGTSSTTITLKDLNKTKGGYYYIDVLAYDAAGNVSATKGISVYVDQTLPTLSNIKVYDITETGYTVSCTATDNAGIARVQFPTWTGKDWQDDLLKDWSTNTKLKGAANGSTYTFRVNTSEHNNEYGVYITHIYAYDKAGNYTMYKTIQVTVEPASDGGGGTSSQGTSDGSTTEIEDQDNTDVQDNTELSPQEKEKIKVIKKKKATISSLKNKKGKKVVVTIKKVKYADGYEIKYSTNSKFKKNVKKVQTKSLKKTLKKLKKGKTYYVKVRPYYKDSSGKITYGKYGKVKKVKIKK